MADKFATLVFWDVGDPNDGHYVSCEGIRVGEPAFAYKFYPADVKTIGPTRRAIGPFNEGYTPGALTVGLINRNRRYSIEKATTVYKGTRLKTHFISRSQTLASQFSTSKTFVGAVDTWKINSRGILELNCKDTCFDVFKAPLRVALRTLNASVFPNLPAGQPEVLVPVVYGDCSSTDSVLREGAPVPCYRIDDDIGGGVCRYVVAQHVCKSVDAIYAYGVLVSSSDYTVSTQTYDGISMTVVDFDAGADPLDATRPNELEVTALVKGITDDGTTGGTLVESPAAIQLHMFSNYSGLGPGVNGSTFVDAIAAGDANDPAYKGCMILAGDINQDWFGVLAKQTEDWLLYNWIDNSGLIAAFLLTADSLAAVPTADVSVRDSTGIAAGSFECAGNPQIYSQIDYQFLYNFAAGKFASPTSRVVADTNVLDARPKLRQFHYVADSGTAEAVASVYAAMAVESVEFVSFDLPARFIRQLDLNDYIAVTHWQGVAEDGGGYDDEIFRVIALETYQQPSQKKIRVTGLKIMQILDANTYTPTLTNGTNMGASTSHPCFWTRQGNYVTVFGIIEVDPTAAAGTLTNIGISLPIASDITSPYDLVGSGGAAAVSESVAVYGDAVNNRAILEFLAQTAGNHGVGFSFRYILQ